MSGFAANNVSEIYDAKVFAVASLLSSFLIYNSVKVIDQADLDYLELLSRRTQVCKTFSQAWVKFYKAVKQKILLNIFLCYKVKKDGGTSFNFVNLRTCGW